MKKGTSSKHTASTSVPGGGVRAGGANSSSSKPNPKLPQPPNATSGGGSSTARAPPPAVKSVSGAADTTKRTTRSVSPSTTTSTRVSNATGKSSSSAVSQQAPKPVQQAVDYVKDIAQSLKERITVKPPPTSLLDMKESTSAQQQQQSGGGSATASVLAKKGSSGNSNNNNSSSNNSNNSSKQLTSNTVEASAASIAKGEDQDDPLEKSNVAIPLSLQGLGGTMGPPTASDGTSTPPSASPRVGGQALAALGMLRQLHQNTNKLLEWHNKVETATAATATPALLDEAEKCIQLHASEVVTTSVSLSKHLQSWQDPQIRAFMKLKSTNAPFEECARAVTLLHTSATTVASVRRVVRERDLPRAKNIVNDYCFAPPPPPSSAGGSMAGDLSPAPSRAPPRAGSNSSRASNNRPVVPHSVSPGNPLSGATTPSSLDVQAWMNSSGGSGTGHPLKPMAPPIVTWLLRTWIPAMELWSSFLTQTKSAIDSEKVDLMKDTLTQIRTEVVAKGSILQEILLPNESLTDLVEKCIEMPLRNTMDATSRRRDVIIALEKAVKSGDMSTLGSRIRAAEGLELQTEEDKKLINEGQQMLINLQKIAKVTVTLSIAQRSGDTMTLVRALSAANSLILAMGLAPDKEACEAAVKEGTKILAQPIANTNIILSTIHPDVLIVDHLPSQAWASELSDLYQVVAKRLAFLFEQNAARKTVTYELPEIRNAAVSGRKRSTVEGEGENATAKAAAKAKALLERCKAAGIVGPELDELSSIVQASTEIQIKVHYDSSTRLIAVPEAECKSSYPAVLEYVKKACKIDPQTTPDYDSLRVRYPDEEGDYILVEDQADWDLLLRNFTHRNGGGGGADTFAAAKVEIYVDFPPRKPSTGASRGSGPPSRGRKPTPEKPRRETSVTPPSVPRPTSASGRQVGGHRPGSKPGSRPTSSNGRPRVAVRLSNPSTPSTSPPPAEGLPPRPAAVKNSSSSSKKNQQQPQQQQQLTLQGSGVSSTASHQPSVPVAPKSSQPQKQIPPPAGSNVHIVPPNADDILQRNREGQAPIAGPSKAGVKELPPILGVGQGGSSGGGAKRVESNRIRENNSKTGGSGGSWIPQEKSPSPPKRSLSVEKTGSTGARDPSPNKKKSKSVTATGATGGKSTTTTTNGGGSPKGPLVAQWEKPTSGTDDLDIHTVASVETTATQQAKQEELQDQLAALKRKQSSGNIIDKKNSGSEQKGRQVGGSAPTKRPVQQPKRTPINPSTAQGKATLELHGKKAK